MTTQANADMIEGYRDGRDPDAPLPSLNRSACYRHGFYNGRDDLRSQPRDSASNLRIQAAKAFVDDSTT